MCVPDSGCLKATKVAGLRWGDSCQQGRKGKRKDTFRSPMFTPFQCDTRTGAQKGYILHVSSLQANTSVIPNHVYLWQFPKALEKKNTVVQEGKEGGDEQFIQSNVFSEIFEMQDFRNLIPMHQWYKIYKIYFDCVQTKLAPQKVSFYLSYSLFF